MKTEPSAPIKIKLEKNDISYSSSANTHSSVKQETKVNFNFDLKPTSIKTCHEDLEIGGSTSVSKVTRTTRKVRRKAGGRRVSTKRKSTYGKVKRKTKGRRKRRTTTTSTTRKTRRKRTTKKLVTGKALTPRARICKKLGIERNLSLGIHSLPTIRKMTQENTINHKRAAAGIGVLSLFGSELNSHGSVPLRDDGPDIDTDLSGVDDRSPLADEQEDSYGPQLPPGDIPSEDNNIDNSSNHNIENINIKPDNSTTIINNNNNNDNNITPDNNNIESTYNENHDELAVIDIKPPVQVSESIVDQTNSETPSEEKKPTPVFEERETDLDADSKAKLKRCKHGKIIHAKKHDNSSISKSKRSSSKDNKKEDPKSNLLKTIKKEPRDRDEDTPKESRDFRENRASRSSLPNRHEVDYPRRLTRSPHHDERTPKHRENDRNRENHLREDRNISDKRKRLSASKERHSPLSTLPVPTTTTTTLLPHLPQPQPPATSSTNRSRSDDNSSKRRSSSSHRRDSSRNNRSPTRRESRRTSPHHEPLESKTGDIKKKFDPEEEDKSKGKKKKRKHKHKHSKYDDEDDYRDTKSSKHCDPIESGNGKRIPTNSTSDKIISSTNNSRHHDHHKKNSKHRHHSRDGRSSPLSSSHKMSTSPHREDRDEKPNLSRSRSKRARHSSPSDRDHISSRNREDRRESIHTKSGKILSTVNSTTNEVNTKEVKVKLEDNHKDYKDHGIPTTQIGTTNNNNVNNVNSKVSRSPSEVKSVLSKPGSPPKKDVRLVSKSRTEFDIFWDENSQNKKVDGSHIDFDPTGDKSVKEETGLRFLPRTLLSDQSSPNVHLPPTVGPRTPPDDERAEKNIILSSPDQTMPTPTQDESLEGDYSNGTPTKQQGSIKSLNSPSVDPDIYDPEAPLESPEDDQLIKSEIARSQAKLNEMEKKLSPCDKQIPAVETVPRPETPELPSPRSPHTTNNNTPTTTTTTNQHKFKSPVIPPLSLSTTSSCRAPTLAESSLPPAPGSLLAQIQKTLNLQTKTHSSHSDSSKQSHQPHSGSTGLLSSSTSSLQSSTFHASGSSGNDQINKSSSSSTTTSTSTLAPNINALSPSLKSLLENLIKAAEQQQSKTKSSKMASSSNVNNIFKKPAPVLDPKSRSVSHSHHHSVKTKVIDKEPPKKVTSSINQGPTPTGSAPIGPGMKISDVAVLDDVPSSAVELQVKEKYLKKLNRQERVVEEVKMVLKPFYQRKEITKDEYKEIMRKAVPKICHSKSGEINPQKVRLLVEGYCQRYKHDRKKSKTVKGK